MVVVVGVALLPETPCAPGFRRLDSFFKFSIPPLGGRIGGWCLVGVGGGLAEGEGAWGSWAPPTIGLLDGLVRAAAVRSRAADGAGIAWLGNGAWPILGPLFDFSAALVTSALGLMKCDH